MSKPKDMNEMIDELAEMFDVVKKDPRRSQQAQDMANIAGKVINATKILLVNAALKGEEPNIPFLGKGSGIPLKPTARLLGS